VTFDFPSWAHITAFVPWSDEWNNVPSGTFCYSNSAGGVYLPGPSPASHYVDSTGGSVYGPQSVQGQNDTLLNASVGFRFQSDPKPLTGESLSTSATTLAPGGTVTLESTTSGGIAPYDTLWEYDGAFGNGHVGSWWNYSTFTPGNYTFVAFGTDAQGDAIASASVTVRVPYPLKVGSLSASTGSGADVGQTVNVSARASGGVDPLSYAWTGLPSGCGSADLPWADCVPAAPGNTTIFLSVTDANGSTVRTPGLFFSVSPRLGVSLSASRTIADLDQRSLFEATASGGSGGLTYGWSGLPSGCSAGGASANCSLTSAGEFVVGVTVADSNHVSVTPASVVLVVHPALSASLSASAGLVDVGRPVTLTAAVSGGSGADQYAWSGLPAGCVGANAPALRCVPSNSSSFWVGVLVTDRANASVAPAPVSLYVYPLLTLRLAANSTRLTAPATVTISPSVLGGSDLVNATWSSVPSGCEATGFHPARCADLGAGNYSITLRVDDVGHGNATTTFAFTVTTPTPPPPPGPGGLSTGTIEVALGLLALAIVGVAIALARRRNTSG
ncbi:MAG TPA: hypothetical protein VGS23_05710, partial [Thermoplasmata archaeon]|nr:hypothetical protein [Thermoplasmata archaeon]